MTLLPGEYFREIYFNINQTNFCKISLLYKFVMNYLRIKLVFVLTILLTTALYKKKLLTTHEKDFIGYLYVLFFKFL